MSFFGFDSSLPRDRAHNSQAPGFGSVPDPFAGLSQRNDDDDEDVLNFEDTYDGLGDQLDETDDAFNADTFGASTVGRDFDFSGQTATARGTLQDQQRDHTPQQSNPRRSPPKPTAQPVRTGYEKYGQQSSSIPQLEANASIWGLQPPARSTQAQTRPIQPSHSYAQPQPQARQEQTSQPSLATVTRKMMSLEEVEAAMRAQRSIKSVTPQPMSRPTPPPQMAQAKPPHLQSAQQPQFVQAPQILQRPQEYPVAGPVQYQEAASSAPANGVPQILQRQQFPSMQHQSEVAQDQQQLRNIDQNQNRAMPQVFQGRQPPQTFDLPPVAHMATMQNRGPAYNGRPMTNPAQLMPMSEEERAAFLAEDAKRAKRNHKIHLLSKDNGLMTPQDKNFITRIQLQQLVAATGGLEDDNQEASLAEDFYFQVYSQIRGGSRQGPNQPLNLFAQTYLNQTAGPRGNRRYPRAGDSQMRRMEQQVQRAVEAAKAKPKNKQLVIEGSLGKISFSNAKTPKPLLNIKRQDPNENRPLSAVRARAPDTIMSRKSVLKDIENLYSTLLKMEDHERKMPAPTTEESSGDEIQEQMDWRQRIHELNGVFWSELKVLEPIDPTSPVPHPFIAILSHPKGKKLIPRAFRQVDDQQRLTILTMIVVHLEMLDVIGVAYMSSNEYPLPTAIRNEVELFSQAVMPSLFSYVNEARLDILIGLLGLVTDRVNLGVVVRTKAGLGLLTMFISRAELIKQAGHVEEADWNAWVDVYNRLFDLIEPHLPTIFTSPLNAGEDMYVWQFLAAVGIGAGPEQQQRLVLGVKERVMDTVMLAKTMPEELAGQRLANVNLFMRAIGLDVELLG